MGRTRTRIVATTIAVGIISNSLLPSPPPAATTAQALSWTALPSPLVGRARAGTGTGAGGRSTGRVRLFPAPTAVTMLRAAAAAAAAARDGASDITSTSTSDPTGSSSSGASRSGGGGGAPTMMMATAGSGDSPAAKRLRSLAGGARQQPPQQPQRQPALEQQPQKEGDGDADADADVHVEAEALEAPCDLVPTDASSTTGESDDADADGKGEEEEEQQHSDDSDTGTTSSSTSTCSRSLRPPLRFVFRGWSVWLDFVPPPPPTPITTPTPTGAPNTTSQSSPSGKCRGIEEAIQYAAQRENVQPIPSPHVTVLYGMDYHLGDAGDADAVRERFRSLVLALGRVTAASASAAASGGGGRNNIDDSIMNSGDDDNAAIPPPSWPPLTPKGVLVDTEYDGINGGTMDMAWMEISLATSPLHERYVDAVYNHFYGIGVPNQGHGRMNSGGGGSSERVHTDHPPCNRPRPWVPHLSLCYDNPQGSQFGLEGVMDVITKYPAVMGRAATSSGSSSSRGDDDDDGRSNGDGNGNGQLIPTGISLWNTEGTMAQWECLERIVF